MTELWAKIHCSDCGKTFRCRFTDRNELAQFLRRSSCPGGHAFVRQEGHELYEAWGEDFLSVVEIEAQALDTNVLRP